MKKHHIFSFVILFISIMFISSCRNKDNSTPEYYEANKFIANYTDIYYLWTDSITHVDWTKYTDPYKLFDDLVYWPKDRWSFVTPDYQEILDEFQGTSKTNGIKFRLYLLNSTSNRVIAPVEYVYPNSPADGEGIKRGDIISKVNGTELTTDNYRTLLSLTSYTVTLGTINNETITDVSSPIQLTNIVMNLNPVLLDTVYTQNGKKIGYFVYDQFIDEYFTSVDAVFQKFKTEQISELVLDLRFNPGGSVDNCQKLASLIVPTTHNQDVFCKFGWNKELNDYILNTEGAESENLQLKFLQMTNNLNLQRLYVLISDHSASASEMTINSLRPFMDIKLIGDTTHGKYTAAAFFYDDQYQLHTWGLYLVISKFSNSLGVSDFVNGFAPDIYVKDKIDTDLGVITEPLLAAALNDIAGGAVTKKNNYPEYCNYKVGYWPRKDVLPAFVNKFKIK